MYLYVRLYMYYVCKCGARGTFLHEFLVEVESSV